MEQGAHANDEAKGMDQMGNNELQSPSKRIRIVLCMLVALAVTAAVPASGFAAEWTSKAAPNAEWTS